MVPDGKVFFSLVVHHHQPVGNFDHVMTRGWEVAYGPFLRALEKHPEVPVAMHVSGPLMRWMEREQPRDLDGMAALVERGQLEVVGGGFYEPIFPLIPHGDRVGQVRAFADYLERRLGQRPRGLWLPERVWEASLASDLAEAGVEYTFLDDSLFKAAGLAGDDLDGYYLTEDLGKSLKIFPICEPLRYLIPFAEPARVIEYLASRAESDRPVSVLYGDDGEKFGMWPKTHRLVWEEGWMERFLEAIEAADSWLALAHPSAVVDTQPPSGKVYLPDGSYREMLEWTLPEAAYTRMKALTRSIEKDGDREDAGLVRAGAYRNFRARYPEANRMYARMLRVSRKVSVLGTRPEAEAVREDLYQGQCNCAYWHGVFGGLYMPHLRAAVQHHLVRAEAEADRLLGHEGVRTEWEDFDQDGRGEVLVSTPEHDVVLRPEEGGHLLEWHQRDRGLNILDVLTRRREVYHRDVARAVLDDQIDGKAETIHGRPRARELGLEKLLHYDPVERASLVERFLPESFASADPADEGFPEQGDAWNGAYVRLETNGARPGVVALRRTTTVATPHGDQSLTLDKVITVHETPRIDVEYRMESAPADRRFGVELSLGIPTPAGGKGIGVDGHDSWREFGERLCLDVDRTVRFVEDDLGFHLEVRATPAFRLWTYPLFTVSNSELGFEKTFQGVGVLLDFPLDAGTPNPIRIELELK